MEEPFREPVEIIPRVDAKATMDKLEAAEPASFAFRLAITPMGLYVPTPGDPVTSKELREAAKSLEFTYFGRFVFVATFFSKLPREIWIDASGTTVLTLRRIAGAGPLERMMSRYTLITVFEDGSAIITWSRSDIGLIEKNERVVDQPGTENLAADYETHLRALKARAEKGMRALQVSDMQTALRVKAWDDSRLRPGASASRIQSRLFFFGGLAYLIFLLIRRFA